MEIIGLGIDICRNERIKNLRDLYGIKFLGKIFHQQEIELCVSRYGSMNDNFFAKRFAGKEAFVKALGVGFNRMVKKNEIVILNNLLYKKPFLTLRGETEKYVVSNWGSELQYFISMSDEKEFSVANVLIFKK